MLRFAQYFTFSVKNLQFPVKSCKSYKTHQNAVKSCKFLVEPKFTTHNIKRVGYAHFF